MLRRTAVRLAFVVVRSMRTWTNAAGGIRERYVPPPDQVCQALQVALPGIESFPTRRSVCADVDPLNATDQVTWKNSEATPSETGIER